MQEAKYKGPSQRNSKLKLCNADLPIIPEKRYFTIGEVAQLCFLKPHVLRYWEQEFPQIKPIKRRGNRRFYQYKDVVIIRQIRKLLYEDGFTIEGALAQMMAQSSEVKSVAHETIIKRIIVDLESILKKL